jgi:hypothetical protein
VKRAWERAVLALAAGLLALGFALVVSPWGAPDEPQHYEYVAALARLKRLPGREDISLETQARLIESMERHDYWRLGQLPRRTWGYAPTQLDRPPIPYALYLPAFLAAPAGDPAARLAWMRIVSVALTALTVWVVARTAAELFPTDPLLRLGPPLLAALTPQVAFIGGSLNSDNLANLVGAATFLALVRAVRPGAAWRPWLAVAALLLVGLATKRTTLFLAPLALGAGASLLVSRWRVARRSARGAEGRARSGPGPAGLPRPSRGVVLLGVAAPLGLIGAAGWLAGAARWVLDRWVANESLALNLQLFTRPGRDWSPATLWGTYSHMARELFESYWARFGWMNVALPPWLYASLMALCALPLLGLVLLARRPARLPLDDWQRRALWLALGAVPLVLLPIAAQYSLLFLPGSVPQGRYLFPALAPIGLLGAVGLAALVPARRRGVAVAALAAGLVLLDVVSLVGHAWPAYHAAS